MASKKVILLILTLVGAIAATAPAIALNTSSDVFNNALSTVGQIKYTDYVNEALQPKGNITDQVQPNTMNLLGGLEAITDCSGWVGWNLNKVAPFQYNILSDYKNTIASEINLDYPRAFVYQQVFQNLQTTPRPGFQSITDYRTLQAGDLVAWCSSNGTVGYCNDTPNSPPTPELGDTGHVMIVAGPPVQITPSPYSLPSSLNPLLTIISVPVFDSSVTNHYTPSSPPPTGYVSYPNPRGDSSISPNNTGVGFGYINFAIDDNGVGYQHQFTLSTNNNPNRGQFFFPNSSSSEDTTGKISAARLVAVPEPSNVMGSLVGIGWGLVLRQKLLKKQNFQKILKSSR